MVCGLHLSKALSLSESINLGKHVFNKSDHKKFTERLSLEWESFRKLSCHHILNIPRIQCKQTNKKDIPKKLDGETDGGLVAKYEALCG